MDEEFVPKFSHEIRGWAIKYFVANKWRINSYIGIDDLMQDAYIYFLRCEQRYSHVKSPKHFMALFQTCIRNHMHDLSYKKDPDFEIKHESNDKDTDIIDTLVCYNSDDAYLEVLISHAPSEIQRCLRLFSDPLMLVELRKPYKFRKPKYLLRERESFNQRLCRLLDLDPAIIDLPTMIREYFGASKNV